MVVVGNLAVASSLAGQVAASSFVDQVAASSLADQVAASSFAGQAVVASSFVAAIPSLATTSTVADRGFLLLLSRS